MTPLAPQGRLSSELCPADRLARQLARRAVITLPGTSTLVKKEHPSSASPAGMQAPVPLSVTISSLESLRQQKRLLVAFTAATRNGEMAALEGLLTEEVVSHPIGAEIVRASPIAVSDRHHIAAFITGLASLLEGRSCSLYYSCHPPPSDR